MATRRPRILDLFCGEGGAGLGYYGAGFEVVGVDSIWQDRYPFPFIQTNAVDEEVWELVAGFDAIHASPPCQAYSKAMRHLALPTPRLIGLVRRLCIESGKPFIIENVPGAPLECPIELCGRTLGLRVRRHRLFECSFPVLQPSCTCAQADKPPVDTYSNKARARVKAEFKDQPPDRIFAEVMGCRWMTKDGSREAIPPAYTRYLGRYLKAELKGLNLFRA